MNAYFATCEQLQNPSLVGKPLVVGGSGRKGIVSTASYEARKYGIHSAMPMFMATKLCKNLIIVPPNFQLYEYYHNEFMSIIKHYFTVIEVASIDECYVDASELLNKTNEPLKFVYNLQQEILTKTGLKCSIGVANNKFLAKMASDMKKPLGITCLGPNDIKDKLWPLDIGDMFGVGKKTAPRLKEIGINTIGDLANFQDEYQLKSILGKYYYVLIKRANGVDDEPVISDAGPLKSVGNSTTLSEDTMDIEFLKQILYELSTTVHKRAVEGRLVGNTIAIAIKYSDFKVINRSMKIDSYTNDLARIYSTAVKILIDNYEQTKKVRLLGVTLQDVKPLDEVVVQMSLFDSQLVNEANDKTKNMIKELNQKMGKDILIKASDLLIKKGKKD
jgi:DNA polymerase-4